MKIPLRVYEQQVKKIWKDYKDLAIFQEAGCEYRQSPLLPEYVKKDVMMFIGMNPSFNKKAKILEHEKEIGFYPIESREKDIAYFEKIKNVANYCKHEWTHLDLFFLRERNQKVIEKMTYGKDEVKEKNIAFLNRQLDITFEIIEKAQPKIIIVSNAFASEFFGKKKNQHKGLDKIWRAYGLEFKGDNFDYAIGTYRINLGNKKVPIIFSGMLSGQRALDLGSLERLKWQIKMILDIEKDS